VFAEPVVYLDLETTGANADRDRITEIGIVETRGAEVVDAWSTLVNPAMPIPPAITALTGISDRMVATAPTFAELHEALRGRLEGKLLVAHNARFDYGFLRSEFARVGVSFTSRVLCTLKLSRRLYPRERRHNLDSLIARHALTCTRRHRALDDARVLHDFVISARSDLGDAAVDAAVEHIVRGPTLPPRLEPEAIDQLPDGPGVYVFYGDRDVALYVGKSLSLRARALSHLAGEGRPPKDKRIAAEVIRIGWEPAAGELGALLKEMRLLKRLMPVHNRLLRGSNDLHTYHWDTDAAAPPRLVSASEVDVDMTAHAYGIFRSRTQARRTLREIAEANGLCLRLSGLEHGGDGPCFAHRLGRCRGACVGTESAAAHGLRLANALHRVRLHAWPFPGRVGIREHDPASGRTEIHVLDRWCHLGTATSEDELHEVLCTRAEVGFDFDTYQLLSKWLARDRHRIEIVPLPQA
jgi:DNA polymerase-3 subunit epsilon